MLFPNYELDMDRVLHNNHFIWLQTHFLDTIYHGFIGHQLHRQSSRQRKVQMGFYCLFHNGILRAPVSHCLLQYFSQSTFVDGSYNQRNWGRLRRVLSYSYDGRLPSRVTPLEGEEPRHSTFQCLAIKLEGTMILPSKVTLYSESHIWGQDAQQNQSNALPDSYPSAKPGCDSTMTEFRVGSNHRITIPPSICSTWPVM